MRRNLGKSKTEARRLYGVNLHGFALVHTKAEGKTEM